tara:strand:+ start:507 stop:752 length:246 start_codon:yes stop_codon:yes gene_type:complete
MMNEPEFEVVEDRPELIRDTYSKGIVNRDTDAYNKYMLAAKKRKKRNLKIDKTVEEINILKEQMSDMQDTLRLILSKVNGN